MTPDTTKPSRELDIYVAKMMGYTSRQITDKYWRIADPQGKLVELEFGDWCEDESRPEKVAWNDVPEFSSDRAAAFELAWTFPRIDFIRNHSEVFVLFGGPPIKTPTGSRQDEMTGTNGHKDDLPLLICQAAIKAKGLQ